MSGRACIHVRTGALSGNIDVGEIPQTKFWKKIPEIQISENFKFWKNFFEKKKNSIKFFKILEIQIPETFPESYSLEKSQVVSRNNLEDKMVVGFVIK